MSGNEVMELIDQIDASIADNDHRIQSEVATYINNHEDDVAAQIVLQGYASIPTSAGDYKITEQQLVEVAA